MWSNIADEAVNHVHLLFTATGRASGQRRRRPPVREAPQICTVNVVTSFARVDLDVLSEAKPSSPAVCVTAAATLAESKKKKARWTFWALDLIHQISAFSALPRRHYKVHNNGPPKAQRASWVVWTELQQQRGAKSLRLLAERNTDA